MNIVVTEVSDYHLLTLTLDEEDVIIINKTCRDLLTFRQLVGHSSYVSLLEYLSKLGVASQEQINTNNIKMKNELTALLVYRMFSFVFEQLHILETYIKIHSKDVYEVERFITFSKNFRDYINTGVIT